MAKSELYAENMSISHLSPYIYYSVLCSDRILMPVLISQIAHCIYTSTFKRLVIWRSVFLFFGTKSLVKGKD